MILIYPHTTLRTTCAPITVTNRQLRRLLSDLQRTLLHSRHSGVGLAAPQIGILKRAIAINVPHPHGSNYRYFLNPVITAASPDLATGADPQKPDLEGCLSIPKIYAPIHRPTWIDLQFSRLDDQAQLVTTTQRFTDFTARVIQHELDHLDGILFVDHALRQRQPFYRETPTGKLQSITPTELFAIFGQF
jgi:peptide deformylase